MLRGLSQKEVGSHPGLGWWSAWCLYALAQRVDWAKAGTGVKKLTKLLWSPGQKCQLGEEQGAKLAVRMQRETLEGPQATIPFLRMHPKTQLPASRLCPRSPSPHSSTSDWESSSTEASEEHLADKPQQHPSLAFHRFPQSCR